MASSGGWALWGCKMFSSPLDLLLTRRRPARSREKIQEEIYFWALNTSADLAEQFDPHPAFSETRGAQGDLQLDFWKIQPADPERWQKLRERIKRTGLRNSLLIAIAPTATIASIASAFECIEPQVSNLFKRETLSGEFLQVNRYLVKELKTLGLWTEEIRNKNQAGGGLDSGHRRNSR